LENVEHSSVFKHLTSEGLFCRLKLKGADISLLNALAKALGGVLGKYWLRIAREKSETSSITLMSRGADKAGLEHNLCCAYGSSNHSTKVRVYQLA
jgi:hypothetical protein